MVFPEKFVKKLIRSLRILAVISLTIFGLYSSLLNAGFASQKWDPKLEVDNPVARWEKRLRRIRDYIPENSATLGYVADWDLPGIKYDPIDQDTEYVLTQYALAPIAVQRGLDHEWIIGNFVEPGFRSWLDRSLHSYEINDLGFGIYLIHRTSP